MLREEGLDNVFARHDRHGEATRRAVRALLLNPGRTWQEEFPAELQTASEIAWSTRRTLREFATNSSS